jgi:hypothetical protein
MLRRLPIDSTEPVIVFAVSRLLGTLAGLGAVVVVSMPQDESALAVAAAIALSWAILVLVVTLLDPRRGLSPLVAVGDLVVLVAVELVAPETYGGVRFAALFLTAAHAHLQGERRGLAVGAIGSGSLVTATALSGDAPLTGDVLTFYEAGFVICAVASGVVVGRLRTAESAGGRGDPRRPGSGADRPRDDSLLGQQGDRRRPQRRCRGAAGSSPRGGRAQRSRPAR